MIELAGESARKALALFHGAAGAVLVSVLAAQAHHHIPMAILVALHIAMCFGFLRTQPWVPWLAGVAIAMGLAFSSSSIYVCVGWLGHAVETYLLLLGLSAYSLLLVTSMCYVVFKREEFSACRLSKNQGS